MNIFVNRYSVRSFSSKRVDEKTMSEILQGVRTAPTALNHQPYFIYVAQTEDGLEKVKKSFAPDYGSSTILIVCSDRNNTWENRYSKQENILQDIGIVSATVLYVAKTKGVDSCYVCNFNPEILKKELNLPNGICPESLIYLGYPSEGCKPSERHYQRRDLKEFVRYIQYGDNL